MKRTRASSWQARGTLSIHSPSFVVNNFFYEASYVDHCYTRSCHISCFSPSHFSIQGAEMLSFVTYFTMLQAGRSRVRFPMRALDFFFNLPNPSSRNMALGSTQPLIEISTSNLRGSEGRLARKADNLTAIYEPIV
jgi:hypothetical protein